jgi:hypothetical protein
MFWPVGDSAVESLGMLGASHGTNRLLDYVELFYPFNKLSRGWHNEVNMRWYALLALYFLSAGSDDAATDWDTSPNFEHHLIEALKEIKDPEAYALQEDTEVTVAVLGGRALK